MCLPPRLDQATASAAAAAGPSTLCAGDAARGFELLAGWDDSVFGAAASACSGPTAVPRYIGYCHGVADCHTACCRIADSAATADGHAGAAARRRRLTNRRNIGGGPWPWFPDPR